MCGLWGLVDCDLNTISCVFWGRAAICEQKKWCRADEPLVVVMVVVVDSGKRCPVRPLYGVVEYLQLPLNAGEDMPKPGGGARQR